MISVVIPLYNKEAYIETTLKSVIEQTFTDFEVIVVNDGSTDTSVERVASFQDPRIQVISIPNSGVSVARNTGIKAANNAYIAFLDGDDHWHPEFLSEMNQLINAYPSNSLFASGRSSVFENRTVRYEHPLLPSEGSIALLNHYEVIAKYLPVINMSNAVVKRELFETKGMFVPGMKNHEDHDLWLRLTTDEPIVYLHKSLSYYRKDIEQSASNSPYSPQDFIRYMKTIKEVKVKLNAAEKKSLNRYANRFIILTYLKYHSNFSKSEDKEVIEQIRKVANNLTTFVTGVLHYLPFKGTYHLLQKLRKSGN